MFAKSLQLRDIGKPTKPARAMTETQSSIETAANVTALFQIGGTIGAVIVGWVMDKPPPAYVVGAAYFCGGLCILALSLLGVLSPALAVLVCSAGFCMSGAQTGLNAFAPGCYPTVARATGVSWMLGIGCFGSIVGSAFGGALLGWGGASAQSWGCWRSRRPVQRSRSYWLSAEDEGVCCTLSGGVNPCCLATLVHSQIEVRSAAAPGECAQLHPYRM
jgi:MFS family permease